MEKTKVLIVEDSTLIAMGLKASIENLGYSVPSVVAFGEDAVEKVRESRPDLILMDIQLAGEMDGIEAAEQIRSNFFYTPIIYLTAYADKEILKRAKITEPFGYLVKPVRALDLHANIEMALSKHKAEEEHRELIVKLHDALAKVSTLQGLLPICYVCKTVKNDKGYWTQIEQYFEEHSEVELSHCVCPSCEEKGYPKYTKTAKSVVNVMASDGKTRAM